MDIELVYFGDCPNWRLADQRLRKVVHELHLGVPIRYREVRSPQEAEAAGLYGSPTVRIDGEDPFAHPGATPGLSCRMYRTPAGLEGAPSEDQLEQAILRARG